MSDILSLDVLLLILEHVNRSDLPALCRLNKTVYPHCRYVLYRDVEVCGANVMQACTTLYQTPALTEKVHRFSLCERRSIGLVQIMFGLLCDLLLMMPNLRILSLHIGPHGSWILPPPKTVPFKLISFSTGFSYHGDLVQFLHGQTELRTLSLPAWPEGYRAWFTNKSLPNLTKIFAPLSLVQELIPDRPIADISMKSALSMSGSTGLDCFAKSTAQRGVTRLKFEQSVLESVGVEHLSTIVPHLIDLTIVWTTSFDQKEVCFHILYISPRLRMMTLLGHRSHVRMDLRNSFRLSVPRVPHHILGSSYRPIPY